MALETGSEFSTYVQLSDPASMALIFGSGPVPVRRWDSLFTTTGTGSLMEVGPERFELRQIECIRFESPVLDMAGFELSPGDLSRWQARNMQPLQLKANGTVTNWKVGRDPQLQYQAALDICLADYSYLRLSLSASSDIQDRQAQIYYRLNNQFDFNEAQVITLPLVNEAELGEYFYDLRFLNLNRNTRLTGLRLDPVRQGTVNGESQVSLSSLQLLPAPQPAGCK